MSKNLENILRTKTKAKQFVNKFFPITEFIPSSGGLMCCPFHDDSRPSAKMFFDQDYPKLYCYACNKQYGSAEYIELILQRDVASWIRERAELNPTAVEAFSDSFVFVETKAKEYPINEIRDKTMPVFSVEGFGRLLRELYNDKERHEWD